MTEPVEDGARKAARGRDEAAPARTLLGVAFTVWAVAAVIAAILLTVWWLLRL